MICLWRRQNLTEEFNENEILMRTWYFFLAAIQYRFTSFDQNCYHFDTYYGKTNAFVSQGLKAVFWKCWKFLKAYCFLWQLHSTFTLANKCLRPKTCRRTIDGYFFSITIAWGLYPLAKNSSIGVYKIHCTALLIQSL